jgi:precorrin-3B synthase
MSAVAVFEVKGWCPGALRPMESGDGLLVRIKPWCGSFTLAQATGLADIAVRLGNGHIDLTRRANLQIRGLRDGALPELHQVLDRLGLLDADAATEAARNVMVGPLADANVRALVRALTQAIVADHRLAALPAKFGWLVDGGGSLSIVGERADVALSVSAEGVALRAEGTWCGVAAPDRAVKAAIALALGEQPLLAAMNAVPTGGARRLGVQSGFFGVGAPFGRIDAAQLAALSKTAGASEIRLSPLRALYIDAPVPDASALGLIVDESDPLLRIEACPGAPACKSSSVDTRGDARRLAARGVDGTIHVSGCAKGCARSTAADLTLVGEGGRYGVVHNGTTRDLIECTLAPEDL